MNKNTTRATVVVGTTMALVIAGTAAVAAAGPRDRDDVRGFGDQQMAGRAGMKGGPAMGGMNDGRRGGLGGGMRGLDADFERTERTVQTADGTTTMRVEQGVVDSASADSLSFSLASGEAVTVALDEDTEAIALEEQEVTSNRGWSHTRLVPTEVEAVEIEAGAEIVVWSDSEDEADFVASRIAIQPAEAEEAADEATEEAADEATEEATEAEEAVATDA